MKSILSIIGTIFYWSILAVSVVLGGLILLMVVAIKWMARGLIYRYAARKKDTVVT